MSTSLTSTAPLRDTPATVIAKYLKVLSVGFQDTFAYRWNFVLRVAFGTAPLLGTVFIWRALFTARGGNIGGYNFQQMVFYFMLTSVVDILATPTEDEWRIAAEIRDGQISALIIKPINHLAYRAGLFVSYRALYTVVVLPAMGVIFWFLREFVQFPHHLATWPLFALSVAMAALLQFFIAYSLAMMAFWILEISTLIFIFFSFEYFLSGQVFPLDLLPGWLHGALNCTPFAYEIFFPAQIFLERLSTAEIIRGFLFQAGWMIAALFLARSLWRVGIRHYQAVGG